MGTLAKAMRIEEYIRDRYEVAEVFERIAEELTLDDALDIIEEYNLWHIFAEEVKGEEDQYKLF